jgi:hypothetical protein
VARCSDTGNGIGVRPLAAVSRQRNVRYDRYCVVADLNHRVDPHFVFVCVLDRVSNHSLPGHACAIVTLTVGILVDAGILEVVFDRLEADNRRKAITERSRMPTGSRKADGLGETAALIVAGQTGRERTKAGCSG